MSQYFALWSIVFGMGFVLVFDRVHGRNRLNRLLRSINLMSRKEMENLLSLWLACQDPSA